MPRTGRPIVRALDCEMVGVGPDGKKSVLIRVSVVSRRGRVLFDCLTEPEEEVTDWRTKFTGVDADSFAAARRGVAPTSSSVSDLPKLVLPTATAIAKANALLDHVVVVGHDLRRDFKLLGRSISRQMLRDTAFYPFLAAGLDGKRFAGGLPSLRALAAGWLEDEELHKGAHSSVEDARAAMLIYRIVAKHWEPFALKKFGAPFWTAFPRQPSRPAVCGGPPRRRLRRLSLVRKRVRAADLKTA
mmetsp:Transcript_51137/g.114853  ORF Transcript_51137/g.114853 Transcript_51137/m.114853 type:complete len:244 (-) Transcript_51137:55-786(-)